MEPSTILIAIRDDLARLDAAAAGNTSLDEAEVAELTRWWPRRTTPWRS
jgi:hypothetical protein